MPELEKNHFIKVNYELNNIFEDERREGMLSLFTSDRIGINIFLINKITNAIIIINIFFEIR
jgi:hypothetical protein